MRNLLARVPRANAEMVAAAVRTIFAQPDAAAVAEQLDSIASKLGRQFPAVEVMLRDAADDLCAFAAFPQVHWKKVWSTNPAQCSGSCHQRQGRREPAAHYAASGLSKSR